MAKKIISLLILIPALNACTGWNLDKLKTAELKGSRFQTSLSKEYLDFAQSEADQYDWSDSSYFAEKGLKVAYGNEVLPEEPEKWHIPATSLATFKDAREKLLATLNPDNKENRPDLTARAQLLYDCWVEQQEENWQVEHINSCREEFFVVMDKLSIKPELPRLVEVNPVRKEPEKATKPQNKTSSSFMVYFGLGSAKVDAKGKKAVQQIAERIMNKKDPVGAIDMMSPEVRKKANLVSIDVIASGHTDSVGKEATNLKLSKKRAEAVKKALVKAGFTANKITIYAFGESDPAVPTKNGTKEPKNRRVEIIVKE